jgi:DNA/RNA non-specific endonuclease
MWKQLGLLVVILSVPAVNSYACEAWEHGSGRGRFILVTGEGMECTSLKDRKMCKPRESTDCVPAEDRISSLGIGNSCVRMYSDYDCTQELGPPFNASVNTSCIENLSSPECRHLNDKARSISGCRSERLPVESCPRNAMQREIDKDSNDIEANPYFTHPCIPEMEEEYPTHSRHRVKRLTGLPVTHRVMIRGGNTPLDYTLQENARGVMVPIKLNTTMHKTPAKGFDRNNFDGPGVPARMREMDRLEGDDRGHILGSAFGAPNRTDFNLMPQDPSSNRDKGIKGKKHTWKKLEGEFLEWLKSNCNSLVWKVKLHYHSFSNRPTLLEVTFRKYVSVPTHHLHEWGFMQCTNSEDAMCTRYKRNKITGVFEPVIDEGDETTWIG